MRPLAPDVIARHEFTREMIAAGKGPSEIATTLRISRHTVMKYIRRMGLVGCNKYIDPTQAMARRAERRRLLPQMLAEGKTHGEIAKRFGVGEDTIRKDRQELGLSEPKRTRGPGEKKWQSRGAISVRAKDYERLHAYCKAEGIKMAAYVEALINADLDAKEMPKIEHEEAIERKRKRRKKRHYHNGDGIFSGVQEWPSR